MNFTKKHRLMPVGSFFNKILLRCFYDNGRYHLLDPFWKAARIVPNKIVCLSYNGRFHADNPGLISDELLALRPDLDIVWLVAGFETPPYSGPIRTVPMRSFRALWELATARIWMNNMRMTVFVPKKREQFYVQTWHSGVGPKKIERDVADCLDPVYVANAEKDTACCDLMLSGSRFFTELCRRAFGFDGEVLECGTPRMDCLFHQDQAKAEALRACLGLSPDETTILYAPTFRQDVSNQPYIRDFSEIRATVSERTGKKSRILLKYHPNVAHLHDVGADAEGVLNVSGMSDIQDLYPIADCLITDYSSTMLEFALLGKPVFLFMDDYASYTRERAFYFSPEELPFPVAFSLAELLGNIRKNAAESKMWAEKRETFFERLGMYETGRAARLAAERILREIPPPKKMAAH